MFLAGLRIPEPYRPGVLALARMSNDSYREFLDAATRSPTSFLSHRELATWIASEVKSIGSGEVGKLIDTLTSLYRLRTRHGVTIPKLVVDVADAARAIPNFKVADGVDFVGRLSALLALDSFNVIAVKAKELQTQSQRTFCDARILTDVRPVFGENVGDAPTVTIIVHTLKIGFHDSGSATHKEIYLALDAADISELKTVLARAEEKERSLKAALGGVGLRSIDLS